MRKYLFFLMILSIQAIQILQGNGISNLDCDTCGTVVYRQKIKMSSTAINLDTLKFNSTKSIFHWNLYRNSKKDLQKAKRMYPTAKIVHASSLTDNKGQVTLFDTTTDSIFSRMNMTNIQKLLYLKEKTPKIKWQISDSTKKIGNYKVKKATAKFRGRNYTAWFTPQIPVPYGPWKLHGLPGLIMQAYDQSGNIYFSTKSIHFNKVGPVGPIVLNGHEQIINLSEYKKIMSHFKKYMKSATLKEVRPYVSKKDFANMTVHLPDVKQMEIFREGS